MGRHARTIRLGRALWQCHPLESDVTRHIEERFFDDGSFPALQEVKKTLGVAQNPPEERPAPFQGRALPFAILTVVAYGQRLAAWFDGVRLEAEAPTSEQFAVLNRVVERVLQEFRLENEGLLLAKG